MRLLRLTPLIVAALASPAVAGDKHVDLAIGVNPPLRWTSDEAGSIGISAYAGITNHHAIRANFARYKFAGNWAWHLASLFTCLECVDETNEGHVTDIGVSWMYFPRQLWSGASLEAGLLRRGNDTYVVEYYPGAGNPEVIDTNTSTYAARALVGWSWLVKNHVFISIAAGLSAGYESGRETTAPSSDHPMDMRVTRDVRRLDVTGETFIRLGGAFDI
jgi:hypothetical protein